MTIHHANGTCAEATIVSNSDGRIRVAIEGWKDVAELAVLDGQWFLNDITVELTFEWERRGKQAAVALDDCICSAELASSLIRYLLTDDSEIDVKVGMRSALVLSAGASLC